MSRYHVYGVGNALVDLEFEIPDAMLGELEVDKGLMTLIEEDRHHQLLDSLSHIEARPCGGGSAANTITACAQLGGKAYYSCKVADDKTGHFFLQDLTGNGVETNLDANSLAAGITGKCIVLVTPDAERSMNTFLGITAKIGVPELDEDAIRESDIVYIEGYLVPEANARAAAVKAREIAKAADVQTALTLSDVNMVKFFKDGLLEIAGDGLNLVFSNQDEAMLMFEADNIQGCIDGMKSISEKFAITRGAQGAVLFDGQNVIEISADMVEPIDSNGAGDIYAGAFMYGLTHGMPFGQCGELAGHAAATLITRFGARLTREELLAVGKRFTA
ncbi:MAG: adenosine kinase [Granulosicoccus sp.]